MDVGGRFREYVRLDRRRSDGGLTPAELHRWRVLKQFLSEHFSPDALVAIERRDSVRVPTCVNVSFATDRDFGSCLTTNMSRNGVFVQTEHPLELKSRFTLNIHVDDPRRDISVPVEVASVGLGPGFAADKQGMGLRFLDVEPEVAKQLEELYENSVN